MRGRGNRRNAQEEDEPPSGESLLSFVHFLPQTIS